MFELTPHGLTELLKLTPAPNTFEFQAKEFAVKIIFNRDNKISTCCAPYCSNSKPVFMIFDGHYCSHYCRNLAFGYLKWYWN